MAESVGVSDLYPAQQILYTLSFLSVAIPAYPSFKGGNIGVILLDIWLILSTGILLIGACVWRGNVNNPAPVYCDISTAILAVSGVGFQAAFLCITRTLHRLSKAQTASFTRSAKRKEMRIDLCIGLGLPFLNALTHGILQGHRYNIIEDYGCFPSVAAYYISMPLYLAWPLCITLISAIYGALAFINLMKRRRQFDDHLIPSIGSGGMKKNLYVRLMVICWYDILGACPFYSWGLWYNVKSGLHPFTTWADLQSNWYLLRYFTRLYIDTRPLFRRYLIVYMYGEVSLAFGFFLMFGLSQEARSCYWKAYWWCVKPLGIRPQENGEEGSGNPRRSWLDVLLRRPPRQPAVSASIPVFNPTGAPTSQGTVVTGDTSRSDPNTVYDITRSKSSKETDFELTTKSVGPIETFRSHDEV